MSDKLGAQPAGGFGAPGHGDSFPPGPPVAKGTNSGLPTVLVAPAIVVALSSILAILGAYGVRKLVRTANTAEATNTVGELGRLNVDAHEIRGGTYCPSATSPVPAEVNFIRGTAYESMSTEWTRDEQTNAGFWCLKFQMRVPQRFQYDYHSTGHTFEALAHGDLNGDGKLSRFRLIGTEAAGKPSLGTSIEQQDPEE